MVFVMTFTNTTSWLSQIVTATMFSPVNETSNGLPENQTMSFSQNPLLENINNRLPSLSANTSLPSGNMLEPFIQTCPLTLG